MKDRAEILDTQIPLYFKVQIEIKAPASKIFDFISRPNNHPLMDGSGTVKGAFKGPDKLYLGAKFGMKMRLGIPYFVTNQVVEFKENHVIAWQHLMKNVWRYELQKIDDNTTLVIESWDGREALSRWWVSDAGKWVPKAMAKTLVNLKQICQDS
ncbi:MAG: hypothetical protein RIT31_1017 [Actinomycetota bacterium]|jgi:hypothetical protein